MPRDTHGEYKIHTHKILEMDVKLYPDTGEIKIPEKYDRCVKPGPDRWIWYSKNEADILRKSGGVDKQTHLIKQIFGGEIVEDE